MGDYNINNPNLPYDLKNPEEVKEYLHNLDKEFKFQCYHYKEADGCHRLGDLLEIIDKDHNRALLVYKHSCEEYNYGHSCFKYGQYLMLGKGGQQKDFKEAFRLFEKGCGGSMPHPVACHNAGLLLVDEKRSGQPPDFAKSLKYFLKGCDLKDGKSCFSASTMYLKGKPGVKKDAQKGLAYAQRSCDLLNANGCTNVSRIYHNGDGVKKDSDMAQKYFDKAKDIRNPTTNLQFSRPG